jgi:fused signal recognition particle receptor
MFSFFKKWIDQVQDAPVDWEDLEAILIQSDLGFDLTNSIVKKLKDQPLTSQSVKHAVSSEVMSLWNGPVRSLKASGDEFKVWLIVGVNGVGKTTTIAKLAYFLKQNGISPFLIAGDTFRAAAVEQLKVWGQRLDLPVFAGAENADPASVVFQGLDEAQKQGYKLVLIDTSGRLHNKENLMRELEKVKRVIEKKEPSAPQETLLVVDGTTGINALSQAKEFDQMIGLTGLVVTKLDSSAKGGTIAALKRELNLETILIGKGEKLEDLEMFRPEKYVANFFSNETVKS